MKFWYREICAVVKFRHLHAASTIKIGTLRVILLATFHHKGVSSVTMAACKLINFSASLVCKLHNYQGVREGREGSESYTCCTESDPKQHNEKGTIDLSKRALSAPIWCNKLPTRSQHGRNKVATSSDFCEGQSVALSLWSLWNKRQQFFTRSG